MIDSFTGDHRFLSNFYPCSIKFDGNWYESVEHSYQAAKTLDKSDRAKFRKGIKAFEAKRLGKKVKLRSDWEKVKFKIMEELIQFKFSTDNDLKKRLLETGQEELIEGNDWGDTIWGKCNGKGQNHLGKILMKVRNGFQS